MASDHISQLNLVEFINKLRDACAEVDDGFLYELPQIVVVGSQSAGKSSVLESFVGRDFLPRGTGIVTRCPLILQLIHSTEEYGEFGHCKDKKFTDFSEIRKEILNQTERLAGNKKKISKDPIDLRIYSPNVLDLTLIDLPGLTKNPIDDQPADIEQQTRDLILKYISKENCLILAVSPANDDLTNSEAIKFARQVDKNGDRTIGVLTKLDMMGPGTNARKILDNKVFPLRLGYVGVVNRSQADIDGKKNIQAALEGEANFIKKHPQYKQIADRMGTHYLQVLLSKELGKHIFGKLPQLQDKLQKQIVSLKQQADKFTELYPTDDATMFKVLTKIIDALNSDFDDEMGNFAVDCVETGRLSCGRQINKVFFERFPKNISEVLSNEQQLRNKINVAIQNIHGVRNYSFNPHMAFESVVKNEILLLKEPVRKCIESVVDWLSMAVRICTERIVDYPKVRENIENQIMTHIHLSGPKYERDVQALIDMEGAYQNTNHEDYQAKMKPRVSSKIVGTVADALTNVAIGLVGRTAVSMVKELAKGAVANGATGPVGGAAVGVAKGLVEDVVANGATGAVGGAVSQENGNEGANTEDSSTSAKEETIAEGVEAGETLNHQALHDEMPNGITNDSQLLDPTLNTDVDCIYHQIVLYMSIVRKTTRDMVPKAIKLYIIDELQEHMRRELLPSLNCSNANLVEHFAMDAEQVGNIETKQKMLAAYEKAVQIIRGIPKNSNVNSISNEA